jgi:tRNA/rRNA methyltransferase
MQQSALSMTTPAIVLVRPQLAENIGMVARAMLNCGLTDLRLVAPTAPWPSERAIATASGADEVLAKVRVYDRLEDAIADCQHVIATCPRRRDMVKAVLTAREAALDLRTRAANGEQPAILFGPERTGLENDEVVLADTLVRVPLNPDFDSLNLAQAVLVMGYEWYLAGDSTAPRELPTGNAAQATKEELFAFFVRLEAELDAAGFLRNPEMRPTMVRNLRNLFHRAGLMDFELRTLHGVLTALTSRPHAPRAAAAPPAPSPSPTAEAPPPPRRGRAR